MTQIQAANLTVKYHDPLAVFIGSSVALTLISFMGAFGGRYLVRVLPLATIRKIGGVVFAGMGIWTVIQIFHHTA